MKTGQKILADRRGTAAVEMALITPIFMALIFGCVELGNYFMSEHAVVKAVRDGARYAARLPITSYSCPTGQAAGTLTAGSTQIKNVTRTGSVDGSLSPRLTHWTADSTITITVGCKPVSTYTGIYVGLPGDVPVVTVTANVAYPSLLGTLGLRSTALSLKAESQAAVMGI